MVSRVFVVEVARDTAAAARQRDRERIRKRRERSGDMWQRGSSGRERAEGKRECLCAGERAERMNGVCGR